MKLVQPFLKNKYFYLFLLLFSFFKSTLFNLENIRGPLAQTIIIKLINTNISTRQLSIRFQLRNSKCRKETHYVLCQCFPTFFNPWLIFKQKFSRSIKLSIKEITFILYTICFKPTRVLSG